MAAGTVTGTVLTAPYFMINSVDLSAYVTSIKFENEKEMFLSGASGKTGKARFAGLQDHKLTVTMHQDFTAGSYPDATLRGIIGTAVPIIISQAAQPEGATNPEYAFYGAFYSYNPFGDGAVGQPQDITLEIYLADGAPATADVT
jgi:hypothetical protein